MGKLEVIFKVRLAYPLMRMSTAEPPAVVYFANTGNTVHIEAPQFIPDITQLPQQGFDQMTLHVERECSDKLGRDFSVQNSDKLQIGQDAAKAFWQLFEAIRESALRRDNIVFIYPVIPSEDLRDNPLVQGYESQWFYDGTCLEKFKHERGRPVIQITDDWWADAVTRLASANSVPVYFRFALDAFYFAQHDPPRGIIMACAAWETALRYYLANEAAKRDPAYGVASKGGNIPKLYEFAKVARGGPVFHDSIDKAVGLDRLSLESYRKRMNDLTRVRNKLLHKGEFELPEMVATDHALAVLSAIEWLFAI